MWPTISGEGSYLQAEHIFDVLDEDSEADIVVVLYHLKVQEMIRVFRKDYFSNVEEDTHDRILRGYVNKVWTWGLGGRGSIFGRSTQSCSGLAYDLLEAGDIRDIGLMGMNRLRLQWDLGIIAAVSPDAVGRLVLKAAVCELHADRNRQRVLPMSNDVFSRIQCVEAFSGNLDPHTWSAGSFFSSNLSTDERHAVCTETTTALESMIQSYRKTAENLKKTMNGLPATERDAWEKLIRFYDNAVKQISDILSRQRSSPLREVSPSTKNRLLNNPALEGAATDANQKKRNPNK